MRLHHTRVIGHRISLVDLIPDGVFVSRFTSYSKKGYVLAFIMGAHRGKVKDFVMLR